MNRRMFACCIALVAFSLPAAGAESGALAVDNAWRKAAIANDLDALAKLYASDAVAWFPNMPEARGAEAIRGALKGLLDANTIRDVAFSETAYRTQGSRSVGWGRFKLVLQPKAGGEPQAMAGRFTVVAEKRGKQWVYVVDHASADPPPAKK